MMIAHLRDGEGPFQYKQFDLVLDLQAAGIGGERWLAEWVTPDAAFKNPRSPRKFASKLAALRNWIEQNPRFDPNAYATFRASRTAVQLESRGFTFVGRSRELGRIKRLFAKGGLALSLTGKGKGPRTSATTLKGFGGQGKTALAHEYAVRYADHYAGILWVNANDLELETALRDFGATYLHARIAPPEEAKLADRFANYFGQFVAELRGKILIILDNIPYDRANAAANARATKLLEIFIDAVPPELVRYYDILITSRRELLPKKVVNMPIERLDLADAIDLFRERSAPNAIPADDADLIRLVDKVLGGHALSITLAASLGRHEALSPTELIARIERRIVDASALGELNLGEEYSASLYATFLSSFEALRPEESFLLLMFSLFRRDELTIDPIRQSVRNISADVGGEAIDAIRIDLDRSTGSSPAMNALVSLGLVERLDRDWLDAVDPATRRAINDDVEEPAIGGAVPGDAAASRRHRHIQVRLHEVIYDFVQAQWVRADGATRTALDALELALNDGACTYAASRIESEEISFLDIETLAGFLLPIVRPDRGLLPQPQRVRVALSFWFDYFKFQNFVYDTGLQELLVGQMEALEEYLQAEDIKDERFELLLKKLIGHANYADPLGESGGRAKAKFDEAIEIARRIEWDPRFARQRREIQWYKVFLLNHRSNLESKRRPQDEQHMEIWNNAEIAKDLREIEATLPPVLRSLEGPPSLPDCELLVRASIYWGHRGNQDNYILYQRIKRGELGEEWNKLVADAQHFYLMGANYRLLALKIFREGQFERYAAKPIRDGLVPHVASWIASVPGAPSREFEAFTSFSQAIGDTGHQYRGYHFVCVLAYVGARTREARLAILVQARQAFAAAKLLWDISRTTLRDGEVLLKYRLWMASSYAFEAMLEAHARGDALPPFDDYLKVVADQITRMQEGEKSSYHFSIQQQKLQLEGIYDALVALGND